MDRFQLNISQDILEEFQQIEINSDSKKSIFCADKSSARPKISVIIPVFQEEKILNSTLVVYEKHLRQKYNIELIVSDGGSSDQTVEIARLYADKIVIHQGPSKQTIAEGRNKGAEAASGDILMFINGDTVPDDPNHFFEFVSNWDQNEKLNKSSALACTVTVMAKDKIFKDSVFYTLHNFYVRLLNKIGIGMGRGECQLVKADVFRKAGGYNSLIAAGEDFDLYRRIAKIARISFTNKIRVFESPRRFRKYGYFRIIFSWIVNSLSVMISGKSVSKEWEAVR